MTTIGFIGSGKIGSTLARLAVDAGHDVVLSNSRSPQTLQDLAAQLGLRARSATTAQAARDGDIVVVTIPLKAYRQVPAEPLRGKVVIDTVNYNPERDGRFPEIDDGRATASGLRRRPDRHARLRQLRRGHPRRQPPLRAGHPGQPRLPRPVRDVHRPRPADLSGRPRQADRVRPPVDQLIRR